uniref:Zinc finger GRF-type domain-containing protein n=1 Tax=Triticum aestivum TaxID=4565 RepID=A0A3B6FI89_WHEAT
MYSASSRATSRMQSRARVEMPVFDCPRCRASVEWWVSHTARNHNRPFYVCNENGVTCFFLWVDALAKTLINELQEEHGELLRMLPQTTVAAARAPEEEMEGEAHTDRELAVELRMLKKKVRKLEDQALPIPICKYFWAFVGMVIALVVMLKMYGKA